MAEGPSARFEFPIMLYDMLEDCTFGNDKEIVSWEPHGRTFKIRNREDVSFNAFNPLSSNLQTSSWLTLCISRCKRCISSKKRYCPGISRKSTKVSAACLSSGDFSDSARDGTEDVGINATSPLENGRKFKMYPRSNSLPACRSTLGPVTSPIS